MALLIAVVKLVRTIHKNLMKIIVAQLIGLSTSSPKASKIFSSILAGKTNIFSKADPACWFSHRASPPSYLTGGGLMYFNWNCKQTWKQMNTGDIYVVITSISL